MSPMGVVLNDSIVDMVNIIKCPISYGKYHKFHMVNIPWNWQGFMHVNLGFLDAGFRGVAMNLFWSRVRCEFPGFSNSRSAGGMWDVTGGAGGWCGKTSLLRGEIKGANLLNLPSLKLTFFATENWWLPDWEATFLFGGAMLVQWSVGIGWMAESNNFLEVLKVYKSPKGWRMHVSSDIHGYHPYKFIER